MTNNIRTFLISFLLVGLFAIAMVAFGVNLASEHGANATITDNPKISSVYDSINDSIRGSRATAVGVGNASESDPTEAGDTLIVPSIWPSLLSLGGIIKGIGNAVLELPYYIGVPAIAVTVILVIIGVTVVLLGWKAIRRGE
jgi:hypothetical protein